MFPSGPEPQKLFVTGLLTPEPLGQPVTQG